jgi:hypothetical protein
MQKVYEYYDGERLVDIVGLLSPEYALAAHGQSMFPALRREMGVESEIEKQTL